MKTKLYVTLTFIVTILSITVLGGRVSSTALAASLGSNMASSIPGPVGQTASDWVLTFNDEFDGTALDRNKWRSDYGNGGNGELQEYVDDDSHNNYLVQNGILSLVARKEYYLGKDYTSGIITTQGRFYQQYGYFEMRVKVPYGKGLWPALWMMPNPTGWPPEIDIMENLGDQPTIVYMTYHYANPGQDGSSYQGPDFSAGYHTFGVKWDANAIVWYIDGIERKRYTDTTRIPNIPMFLLANLAVGGNWPGSPDATTIFPAYYDIDYIRAWKLAPPVTPTPTAIPTGSTNMIDNGSFENLGLSPWYSPWSNRNDLGATFTQDGSTFVVGSKSFKATLTSSNSTQPWVVGLMQKNKALTAGQAYTLSFWAKASAPRTLIISIQEQISPYTEYSNHSYSLTTAWAKYSYTFNATTTTSSVMLNFNLASATGDVWLDNVALCQGTSDCSAPANSAPPAPAPTATSLPPTATPTTTTLPPTAAPTSTSVPPTTTPTATGLPASATPTASYTPSSGSLPVVTITNPANGSFVNKRKLVSITANATDDQGIAKVEFRVNGSLICTDTVSPYTCSWRAPNTTNVTYTIEAKAYDLAGNSATATVKVTTK